MLARSVALVVLLAPAAAFAVDAPACPAGWYSAPDGSCLLATCPGHQCRGGDECKQTSLCFMPRKQGDPPRPGGDPIIVQEPLDVCVNGAVCTPGATCAMAGLCLASGATAAAAPKNASPVPVPYSQNNDMTKQAPKDAPKTGGCGACAVGSVSGTLASGTPGLLAATLAMVALWGRRARRSARR